MAVPVNPRLQNLLASLTLNLAEEGRDALEAGAGLTGGAAEALLALAEFLDGAHVGRLADVLGLTHSGAVRLVTQLERAGLAERRSGTDRRRVEVRLTDAGRERARVARAARDEVVANAVAGLSAAEGQQLESLLARLVEARAEVRVGRRREGAASAWWCRTCDFAACGRPEGRCPARATAQRLLTAHPAGDAASP